MTAVEKLEWLTNRNHGLGVPVYIVAQHVGCHPSTLQKYIAYRKEPSARLEEKLTEAIQSIYNMVVENLGKE